MKHLFILFLCIFSLTLSAQQKKLLFFMENGKFGYADTTGKTIIPPLFVSATDFFDGLAAVAKGENLFAAKRGFINTKGEWIIPATYAATGEFSEGLARVQVDGKWAYIDTKGKTVITPQFQLCYEFKNGYAKAQTKNQFGLIDKTGKFIVQPQYYSITNFTGKVLGTQKTMYEPWFLTDIKGNKISESTFSKMSDFSNGLAPARNKEDKWGFINESAEWIILPAFTNAHIFSEGFAFVEIDYSKWTFINTSGEKMIPAQYDRHAIFRDGFARVEKGSDIQYINTKGDVVFSFKR